MHGLALVILTTIVPWLEYRAAIPLMVELGIDPMIGLPSILLVNTLVPALALIAAVNLEGWIMRLPLISKLLEVAWRWTARSREKVEKYGYPALALLVFVPLPGSGMWTAVAVAFLLRLRPLKSILFSAAGLVPSALLIYSLVSFFT